MVLGRRLGDSVDALHGCGEARLLRVLVVPPKRWESVAEQAGPGEPLEYENRYTALAAQGINTWLLNPFGRPWNPFSGRHPLFEGLDLLRTLRILAQGRRFDAVLTVCEAGALLLLLLRTLAGFRPPVVSIDLSLAAGWQIRGRVLDLVVPRLDGIIVLGSNQIDYIRQRWSTRAPLAFIHQHVDTAFFHPVPFVATGPALTVGDDVGRDYDTLLRAINGLDVTLVAKTRQIPTERCGLPRIQLIRERMHWSAFRDLYAQARFVILPLASSVHSSGVSGLLEAMATGRAVIVTDSPGLRDYIVPDVTALVVPCGDAAAMRSAIIRLSIDDALCRRLGEAGRAFVEANCTYEVSARRTARFLRQVVRAASDIEADGPATAVALSPGKVQASR